MDTSPLITMPEVASASRKLPNAKDMNHHVNEITKNRQANKLKEMYKYAAVPGMIPMAGGIPSPANFPFEKLSAELLPYDHLPLDPARVPSKGKHSLFSWLFGRSSTSTKQTISIPKYADDPTDPMAIQLATSLQYQQATGPPAFPVWLRHYVQTVYRPAYADWDVLLDVGATDGMAKVCSMLLNVGDSIMVEEWTYPGAMGAYLPFEVNVKSLKMDSEGILPQYMESVLAGWDVDKSGPRPRLLYTVPTGQNPTGATMSAKRRKAVYDICAKYDVVIVEDEPYYCLFVGSYHAQNKELSPLERQEQEAELREGADGHRAFFKAIPPSFLHYDTDGRVIRLDTFSKTSCPGSRLGWITSSPIFIERLTRISESSTQAPSGFATALTITMLNTWGWDGYVRWLRGLKALYRVRRDWICDALNDYFHLEEDYGSRRNPLVHDIPGLGRAITAYARPEASEGKDEIWDEKRGVTSKPLVSFIPPNAGMFVFLAVHLNQHRDYHRLGDDATGVLMNKLWRQLAEHLVLFAPGLSFDAQGPHNIGGKGIGYFRISYSIVTYEETRKAIKTFAGVLKSFLEG